MVRKQFILGVTLGLAFALFSWPSTQQAQASCGAVTCFVVIGSQQQVPQAGVLTVNALYNYTPMRLLDGTNGVISAVDQATRQMILDHHQETRTITQQATLDLNYGLTERFGLQLTLPYMWRTHKHIDGLGEDGANGEGEPVNFSANGIGDMRVGLKYNVLPTLRSMVVLGLGVYLPTGNTHAHDSAENVMESPTQLGRGQVGLNPTIYQTYELIPHRLNQFASASYRHTFRNNDGYLFGDEYLLNAGLNLVTTPWLVLTGQVNYRYLVHDNFSSSLSRSLTPADAGFPGEAVVIDPTIMNRAVPNTGSTYYAFSPGFQVGLGQLIESNWTNMTSLYFFAQIPFERDSNNNLAQGTSYIFGLTRSFQVANPS
ncbi:MAG TPA: transporter [Nitrospiraceae bacterium]|nr:transporter [Nitrospiraceae bacterium]